jgi:hypothetical protein
MINDNMPFYTPFQNSFFRDNHAVAIEREEIRHMGTNMFLVENQSCHVRNFDFSSCKIGLMVVDIFTMPEA